MTSIRRIPGDPALGPPERRARSMSYHQLGRFFVLVHPSWPPAERDWDDYLGAVRSLAQPEEMRTLVYTEGGSPSSRQREQLNEILAGQPSRAAILTSARPVRMVVTALSWFNPEIRAFAPHKAEQAFDYLDLTEGERRAATSWLGLSWGEAPER